MSNPQLAERSSAFAGGQALTCDQWLPLLVPYLAEALVSGESLGRIERLARRLPGGSLGAIEVRLGAGSDQVDLAFRLTNAEQARQFADRVEPTYLRNYLHLWADSPDHRVPFLWVEFDLDDEPDGPLHPFFASKLNGHEVDAAWLTGDLLPAMAGEPLPGHQVELIQRSYSALPPQGSITYVANLKARDQTAVRMDYFGLRPELMQRHLRTMGCPDLAEHIAGPSQLLESAERFHFSHDIDDEILPRIGMEASFGSWPSAQQPDWRQLFDTLVEAGLCTPEKRDAALAWNGYDSHATVRTVWPEAAEQEGFMVRFLSHIKLVCHPGQEPVAKTYLMFGQHTRDAEGRMTLTS
ncbi:MAG: hypothetical protein AAGC60_04795 [Acidobacteriota bacterium]